MDSKKMTPKCEAFLDALRAICIAHGVTISPSGYDALQVWDADATTGPVHFNGIEDRTMPNALAQPRAEAAGWSESAAAQGSASTGD